MNITDISIMIVTERKHKLLLEVGDILMKNSGNARDVFKT